MAGVLVSAGSVLEAVRAAGHVVYDKGVGSKPWDLQVVGFRNPVVEPNVFNDRIVVVCRDDSGELRLWSFKATTDPGNYWMQNPMNVKGTAILKAGQYAKSHSPGLHSGKKAWVQVNPVTVWRDGDRDLVPEYRATDTGLFGINIHRAGSDSVAVDKWSAGCQVIARDSDYETFYGVTMKQVTQRGWNYLSYTLLEGYAL